MTITPVITPIADGRGEIFDYLIDAADPNAPNGVPFFVHAYKNVTLVQSWTISGPGAQDALDHWYEPDFIFAPTPPPVCPVKPISFIGSGFIVRSLDMQAVSAWVRPRLTNYIGLIGYMRWQFHCG